MIVIIFAIVVLVILAYMSFFQTHMCAMEVETPLPTNSVSSTGLKDMNSITWRPVSWWKFEEEANHYVTTVTGNGIRLTLEKTFARPGDRWNEVMVDVYPTNVSIEETCLKVRLFKIGTIEIVEEVSVIPKSNVGELLVDLHRHSLNEARLSVELFEGTERTGAAEIFLKALSPKIKLEPGQQIEIGIDVPEFIDTVENWPVTFGVPFPAGALWNLDSLSLVNGEGEEIPHQKEITGLWASEGAIKWVRFDALVSSEDGCFVEVAAPDENKQRKSVQMVEEDGHVTIYTGVARYVLSKDISPIESVWLGEELIATGTGTRGLYVIDQIGRVASASADGATMEIEADGPVAACVRLEGFYKTAEGKQLARHITRVEAFAGQPLANITHTLILTNDSNEVWFKDIGWEFAVQPGTNAKAIFGISREEPSRSFSQPLNENVSSAFMIQDSHFRFARGKNHFSLIAADPDTELTTIFEGEEMGDWALLSGNRAAFLVSCRESARQHPKEFEVFQDKIVLRLFSNRAGEELDFRPETLVKKWNLDLWLSPEERDSVAKNESNAIGWSKTHELVLAPISVDESQRTAARLSRLHSRPVYASVVPSWVWKTKVMGPLHPKDPERFPAAEQLIDAVFDYWNRRGHEPGFYGFADYYSGPVCWGMEWHLGNFWGLRYRYTYTLRPDLWFIYARSGERAIREFAEGTNRAFLDNYLAHWDGPNKTRGLLLHGSGDEGGPPTTPHHLPFYWETHTTYNLSGSTDLNMFILDYHLTGYRRAKDAILQFADGLKRAWHHDTVRKDPRIIMVLRVLTQTYAFTWDEDLRVLAEATTDLFYDPQGELALNQERPNLCNSWKTETDVAALLEAWEVFGTRRYYEMATKVANFWWYHLIGSLPNNTHLGYTNPMGQIGNFLYGETGDSSIPAALDFHIRWGTMGYDPKTGKLAYYVGRESANVVFVFRGIPYAQDVLVHCQIWSASVSAGACAEAKTSALHNLFDNALVRSGADKKIPASWVAYQDEGVPASVIVFKEKPEIVELTVKSPHEDGYGEIGSRIRLRPLREGGLLGPDLTRIWGGSTLAERIRIPKDAPKGAYEIIPKHSGIHFIVADSKVPLVIHAPEGWYPLGLRPQVKVYFKVPEGSQDVQIYFEGSARLFDPEDNLFRNGEVIQGIVDLPTDKPGLWSFEAVDNGLVRVNNLPPFFAIADSKHYFEPAIS